MCAVKKSQDWAVLPYSTERINNHYLVSNFFGNWEKLQYLFDTAGKDAYIAPPLLKPG